MADPLAEVIRKTLIFVTEQGADLAAAAVRAAGYKSPEEVAAALDAKEAEWHDRLALLGTTEEAHGG